MEKQRDEFIKVLRDEMTILESLFGIIYAPLKSTYRFHTKPNDFDFFNLEVSMVGQSRAICSLVKISMRDIITSKLSFTDSARKIKEQMERAFEEKIRKEGIERMNESATNGG